MSRTVAGRHLEAAASVTHGLRNLLAPAQLRLDAWSLRGPDVAPGGDDLARLSSLLRDVVQIVDGLELLRLAPTDRPPVGATSWPNAVRALLSCIAAGAPCEFELAGDTQQLSPKIPQLFVTHLLVDLALVAQAIAPRSGARYTIGAQTETVHVSASFSGVRADVLEELAGDVRRVSEDALCLIKAATARVLVETDETGVVTCHVEVPTVTEVDGRGADAWSESRVWPFSVLCIDDNEHLLDALEERLRKADGFSHFLRSGSVTEALALLEHSRVSVVLVDVHLSTTHDPLASISLLRAQCPGARVALFSGSADHGLMELAAAHGADGFVFKGMTSQLLVDAIMRLARGDQVWAPFEE